MNTARGRFVCIRARACVCRLFNIYYPKNAETKKILFVFSVHVCVCTAHTHFLVLYRRGAWMVFALALVIADSRKEFHSLPFAFEWRYAKEPLTDIFAHVFAHREYIKMYFLL